VNSDDPTNEQAPGRPGADRTPVEHYEIRVVGRLSPRWGAWFDGLTLTCDEDGSTVISGPIVDQAALHGLLQRLRDLGITLLSLSRTGSGEPVEHSVSPTSPDRINTPGANS
jgi:hypothetical protein